MSEREREKEAERETTKERRKQIWCKKEKNIEWDTKEKEFSKRKTKSKNEWKVINLGITNKLKHSSTLVKIKWNPNDE